MRKIILLIALAIVITIGMGSNQSAFATVLQEAIEERDLPLTTYAVGWWGGGAPATNLNDDNIQKFYLRQGMRFHYQLGATWWQDSANTSISDIFYIPQIDEFLDITDRYGIPVLFKTPITGYGFRADSEWKNDVLTEYPDLATYDETGQVSPYYIRVDSPNYAKQIFEDLKQLWQYYGRHPSWIGFTQSDLYSDAADINGGGGGAQRGYYMLGNYTIKNWYNSNYYTPVPEDASVYDAQGNPIVPTSEVFNNIISYHEAEWRNYVRNANDEGWTTALNNFTALTGKPWFFALNEFTIETPYKISRGDSLNGNPVTQAKLYPMMRSVTEHYLEGMHFTRSSLLYTGQTGLGYQYPENEVRTEYSFVYPFYAGQPLQFMVDPSPQATLGLENVNSPGYKVFTTYGQTLNRMRNVGSYFGIENPRAPKVLLITDGPPIWPQFLTPALNVTWAASWGRAFDTSLTKYGDFSQFDAILIDLDGRGGTYLTQDAQNRLKNFVQNGGGLIFADEIGDGNSIWLTNWNNTWAELFGFRANNKGFGADVGTLSLAEPNHPLLRPYGNTILSGGYYPKRGSCCDARAEFVQLPSADPTIVVNSTNLGPQMWVNNYGNGRTIFLPVSVSRTTYYRNSPNDAYYGLLINAAFFAAKRETEIPVFWYSDFKTGSQTLPWSDSTFYSVLGTPGKPLLVWVFTESTTPDNIELNLSATFYGIDRNWIAVSALDWSVVAKGNTDQIKINVTIPAQGWAPIYIMSDNQNLVYSNIKIQSEATEGTTRNFTVKGAYAFPSWLITKSENPPTSIRIGGNALRKYDSLVEFNNSKIGWRYEDGVWNNYNEQGWYYDDINKLIYVAFNGGIEP